MKFKQAFSSPYETATPCGRCISLEKYQGQPFEVLRVIDRPDEDHGPADLPMYVIRFADGQVIEAWPEEVEAA